MLYKFVRRLLLMIPLSSREMRSKPASPQSLQSVLNEIKATQTAPSVPETLPTKKKILNELLLQFQDPRCHVAQFNSPTRARIHRNRTTRPQKLTIPLYQHSMASRRRRRSPSPVFSDTSHGYDEHFRPTVEYGRIATNDRLHPPTPRPRRHR